MCKKALPTGNTRDLVVPMVELVRPCCSV